MDCSLTTRTYHLDQCWFFNSEVSWYLPEDNFTVSARAAILFNHYIDVIMTTMASQITSITVVYSTVYSDADQRKHQSSASLAFVWGIHRDRWIPRTNGQLRGKCFHLMTSSWSREIDLLTHWGRGKMDAISQTTFSSAFSWIRIFEFRLKFHWSLFLRVQLTIFQHWFR